jgi:hypothetical protein
MRYEMGKDLEGSGMDNPDIVHVFASSDLGKPREALLRLKTDPNISRVRDQSVTTTNPEGNIHGDSKLLPYFPWPIYGNSDNNLELPC